MEKMMEIAFNEILGTTVTHRIVDDGWFPHDDIVIGKPVDGSFSIRRTSDSEAVIKGVMSGTAQVVCDRCGRSVDVDLTGEFTIECIVGKEEPYVQHEVECREEDFNKIYLEESVVNVGDILREQVLLAMPISVLCHQSCKGLCAECGIDLNSGSCTCDSDKISSQFAVLQQLKGR